VRFALEVVKACGEAIGFERVGIRLSPAAYLNDIHADLRDASVFSYLLTELNALSIAYVHTGNFNDSVQYAELNNKRMTEFLRCHFNGTVIASGGYDHVTAQQGIETGQFDMVAIGRPFIANPDYISRISQGQSLQSYDAAMLETLY
jgi:2,4-dienoyl-CoA reductase-like NADH-dependent reductase (Old Yellow Enzyme family)